MTKRFALLPLAILATIALLASVAGAATRTETMSTTRDPGIPTERIAHVDDAAAAQANEEANDNERANESADDPEDETASAGEPEDETGSAGGPHDQTTGARPGFGCGDENHEHSGPAGRTDASTPPGCAKAGGHESERPLGASGSARIGAATTSRVPQIATERSGGKAGGTSHR